MTVRLVMIMNKIIRVKIMIITRLIRITLIMIRNINGNFYNSRNEIIILIITITPIVITMKMISNSIKTDQFYHLITVILVGKHAKSRSRNCISVLLATNFLSCIFLNSNSTNTTQHKSTRT